MCAIVKLVHIYLKNTYLMYTLYVHIVFIFFIGHNTLTEMVMITSQH